MTTNLQVALIVVLTTEVAMVLSPDGLIMALWSFLCRWLVTLHPVGLPWAAATSGGTGMVLTLVLAGLVWTDLTRGLGSATIAVKTQRRVSGWPAFLGQLNMQVYVVMMHVAAGSIRRAVVINMVQCQEQQLRLAATCAVRWVRRVGDQSRVSFGGGKLASVFPQLVGIFMVVVLLVIWVLAVAPLLMVFASTGTAVSVRSVVTCQEARLGLLCVASRADFHVGIIPLLWIGQTFAIGPRLPMLRLDQWVIAADQAKIKILSMGRRYGKTTMAGAICVAAAWHGSRVAWIAPTYKNTRPLWRFLIRALSHLPKTLVQISKSELTVEFLKSGGFIGVYTGENGDSMRGEAFHLVVVDEAAKVDEVVYSEVIVPTVADFDGDIILISTPRGRNWFYRLFQVGKTDGQVVKSWTAPTTANPIPQIQKAAQMAADGRIPESAYRQEFLAEFLEGAFQPWSAEWYRQGNRYHVHDDYQNRRVVARFISWDTAMRDRETSAYSAAVVVELLADWKLRLRYVYREKLSFPNLLDQIERLALEWNRDGKLKGVVIEDKSSGTSALQSLKAAARPHVAPYLVGYLPHQSKEQRADLSAVWGKVGAYLLPWPDDSLPWLAEYERELYDFPGSDYKDQVDATSQVILYLENYLAVGVQKRRALADEQLNSTAA